MQPSVLDTFDGGFSAGIGLMDDFGAHGYDTGIGRDRGTNTSATGQALPGYLNSQYAASLEEFGSPRELQCAGGWLLERSIPGSPYRDAMGCYPLFCCQDWAALQAGMDGLQGELVSVALAPDPFGEYTEADLRRCFDLVVPFKESFVVDLESATGVFGTAHHRYYARRALKRLEMRVVERPLDRLDDWVELYGHLVERHGLTGIKAFSRAAFRRQLALPGSVLFLAMQGSVPVAGYLWFVHNDVAYSHLRAMNPEGYKLRAGYALYAAAIEHFRGKVRWLNLGSGAGAASEGSDGLTKFKAGWATGTRPRYFCGKILQAGAYLHLTRRTHTEAASYFPAYRSGELA